MIGRRAVPSTDKATVDFDRPLGFDDFDVSLGDIMRGERATLGKSLLDVQRELKIKAAHIAAIENCDVAAFETPSFIAGYVRSYAKYLGMDPEQTYARFCEESGFTVAHGMSAMARPSRSPAAQRPEMAVGPRDPLANVDRVFAGRTDPFWARVEPGALGSMLVVLLLIGGIGYGGWSVLREIQRVQLAPLAAAPEVLADLDPIAAATRSGGADPAAAAAEAAISTGEAGWSAPQIAAGGGPDRPFRPQALDRPVLVARDGPIAAINPDGRGATTPAPGSLTGASGGRDGAPAAGGSAVDRALAEALGLSPDARPGAQPGPVQVLAAGPPRVEIVAVRPAWVRVRAPDGTVLLETILAPGQRYEVPQTERPATLRTGNSGAVYFVVDGRSFGPAAPGGQVVDNIALSASALTERFPTARPGNDPDLPVHVAEARDQ